jgi:hypothetical protein
MAPVTPRTIVDVDVDPAALSETAGFEVCEEQKEKKKMLRTITLIDFVIKQMNFRFLTRLKDFELVRFKVIKSLKLTIDYYSPY